ncbi:uncharacterized protein LOC131856719 [Cryptomeria japonica]|uniref:uncharacterized protein LOC131856719 n=1 Tax=Cryptomeria japonica TaxID=3369 RepID=UPI0027DA9E4F|nr:uncharacterized protein LOC131856719 [Cryptomeria japonica]
MALAATLIETDGRQKEPGASSKLDYSIAIIDQEQKQTEILIGDVEEEKRQEEIQQQPHPADHMEAVEIAQTLSLDQDSGNAIVAVYNTSKLLPADDDQYQQLAKKIIQEPMSDANNELLAPEGSFTQEAHETYLTAPIPEDATEVSAFEMSAMTDENTSKTIETRNNNVLQRMSNTASELFQQAHTAITEVVEMNIGNETCNVKKESELQGVKEDSRVEKEKDEAETFQSEEKKLTEDSLPQAPMFSSIESCEASKSSLLIELPSKEDSVNILQSQTEDEAHPKELAKEPTLYDRSNAEAEFMVEASSLTEEVREVQVIQPTVVNSTSGINETEMGEGTANLISSLEFQIAEHMLISQEGKDEEINQIKYINKDDGGLKQALNLEIAASQNVDTSENANKLSSNEKQLFHVPEVNEPMPTQEEASTSISQDRVIVSDDLTSDEIDNIDHASVTENFESPDKKLNCETDIDSVEEVLQTMKVATDIDLQEINESTTQPMQHGESTVNENSSVLCDTNTITDGATTVECKDGEEINKSSPRFELPIHTDKEDGYVEKMIGQTEECQVQEMKLYENNILEGSKLETAASSENIKVVQTQPEEEENIKSHIQANNAQSEHSTSDKIQTDSTREMFPPATGDESQGRSESATYIVQDNEPIGTEYLANHQNATAKTHNAETAESTSGHEESERSPFLEQWMTHEKVLEQTSQHLPPDLAQPLETVHKASLDEESYGQVPRAQEISEIVPSEGSEHQEESTIVVNVAAVSEKETAKTPESPRDLSLSFDKEETSSLHETNKFSLLVPITEVEVSKAVSTFDTGAMADEHNSLVLETRSDDLLGTNTAHSPVQQEEATLNVQMSYIKESVVVDNVATGSEKETAKTPESQKDLKFSFDKEDDSSMHETTKSNLLFPISEVEVSHAVSAFDTGAITDKDSSPPIDAGSNDLLKIFDNSLALVQDTEATLHEQMSSLEDPTAMTYVAAGIEKKTVSETPEPTKDLLPSLEKEVSSSSHEDDKSNLVTPIPQGQELEAVSAFDTGAVTNEESICLSVTKMENNNLQGMTDNAPALVRQGESTLNKQMSSTEDSVIVTNVVTGFEEETVSKIPESTRGLNSSFEMEEASSSYTTDGSHLMVQVLEVESSEDALAFDMGAMTKNNNPPVIESGNDDIARMNNAGTALSQQAETILHEQKSSGENSVAVSHVAAVPVPKVEESEAVSTFSQGATTRDIYPAIDTGNNDSMEIPITVPVLIKQTEASQHEQMSSTKDSLFVTREVTGIVKEVANITTESSRDLKLSFDEEKTSRSLETDEYNITMPIPKVEASESISAFDTGKMTDKESSLVIERGYNDLLEADETLPILVQQVEATLHEKTLSIEDAVIMNHFAAGKGEATESDTLEKVKDLQLSINEEEVASSHETDKSNLMVQIQDTQATGAISVFYASAITDKNNSPVIESGNYDLQGMTNTTTILVQQAELASLQKMSFEEEAIVVTHVSARIEKKTSSDTPESTRCLQLPFEEEDTSSSHETDEFELVSLPDDTTPGADPTFDTGEGADKDSSPVMETGNNKLLVMTNTVDDLVVQTEAVHSGQTSSIDNTVVVTQFASGIEKETACKTLESMGDSHISFEEKETSNSYDIDTSHLPVPIPQLAELKVPVFDADAMADERISPIIETRNDDSQRLTADLLVPTNNTPCLDHQVEATLHQKMSSIVEVPVDETNVSAQMLKETITETTESTRDLQLPFNGKDSLCEIDKSNPGITITEAEASEETSDFDTVAMTDKNIFPVTESENNDSLGMTHTKTGLVQQDGDALLGQMSHVEDSKVVTQVSAEIAKETSSEILQSTRDLQLLIEDKETSSLQGNEKSSLMAQIPEVEEEEASRSHENDKSNLTVPILEVEEEDASSSSETNISNLTIPIPEDVSILHMGADATEDGSLVRKTENSKLGGDTNTVPALVPQTEATLTGQMSSTDNSVVVTQVATGVQKETANETPESIGDLHHPFEEEEDSNSYDIDKFNLAVSILEVEATESASAIVTDAITDNENSPDKQTRNDDSLGLTDNLQVLTNIKPVLVQQTDDIINEQILSIKDSAVEENNAARTEKETMSETIESTGDLKFSFEKKESLHEIDKSNITIPIPEVKESEPAPAFEIVAVTDKIIIPAIQSENNDLLGMTNTKTALVQQIGGSLLEQMTYVEESMVVTQVSAGIVKETSSETLESTRDLRLSAEEKEASSLQESDKSSQMFQIQQAEEEDASSSYKSELMTPIPEAISTFDMGSEADKDRSPTMEIGSDKLKRVTNTVPALVAQAEVTLNEDTSAIDNLIVVTQVTTGIDEVTANETHQSGGDLQLPFKEEETSNLYEIDKSNLAVLIPELEATEAVSAFDTGDMTREESSPATETSSHDSPELTNDLLVLTNIEPDLVQQTKATLHEQMSTIKVPVVEMQDAAANEKETVGEIPESTGDLQPSLGEKESVCGIDKSNITVLLSEVEESVAATAIETDAVTDKTIIPVIQSENNDLVRMTNTETALVQQNGATLIEQMSCVEDPTVMTQVSAGIGKETSSKNIESTKDLQLSAKEKESLSQTDKSNVTVPFSEVEESEADQASEIDAVTDKFITTVIQSENDNLLGMTNTKTAQVQKDGATLLEQMSCVEDSIVLPQVSEEIEKETSSGTLESTKDSQLSVDNKETSNLHDSNKSSQMFHNPNAEEEVSSSSQEIEKFELISPIPEDTTSEAVSTFDIRAEANREDSPAMETGNNKLVGVTNTVPALVAQAEVTLNDQASAADDSIVVTQVAAGNEEENPSENRQSMEDLQLSFEDKEASNPYDDKSNLKVSITEVEETEAVSAFDTDAMTHEVSSPVIETRNDDSLGLNDDLLAQQAEPTQNEQMSTIDESVAETHEATGTKKETVSETPELTRDLNLSVEQEESLREIDKSNISVPISKFEELEAAPAFEMIAVTDNIIIPVRESENNNLLEMSNTETALVHQDQATILEEMSCLEDSMVVTQVPARIGKEASTETLESKKDLQLSVEEKEASSFHESDKSSQTFGTPEVEEDDSLSSQETEKSKLLVSIPKDTTSETVSADDIGVEAYQDSSPAVETGNNKLMGVINTVPLQVAQAENTLNEQTSSKDDSIVAAQASGIDEETACGTPQTLQDLELSFGEEADPKSFDINKFNLVVPITEVEETKIVSAFDIVAMTHEDSSPVTETRNDDSLRFTDDLPVLTSPGPALVQQSESAQHEQMSSIEELVVETHDATENNKETMSEISESTGDLKLSSEQEESLCEIDKSYITAPIPKVEALEAAPAFEMTAMTDDIIIPVGESENDDLLEVSNPETALVHQDPATLLDQISCVEDSMVVTNVSAGIGKDTSSETPDSTRDLQLSFEEKEASIFYESNKSSQMVQILEVEEEDTLSSHETDKSELLVQIPEDTTPGALSTIDIDAGVHQDESPCMETENNKLVGVISTVPALVAQTQTTSLNEQTSYTDDSVAVTNVAAGIEEETATETLQSTGNTQLSFAEEESSHSYDNGKSNAVVPILEVEAAKAVSAIDTCAMTHEKISPVMEIKNDGTLESADDLLVPINTKPAPIRQAEATPHEQIPLIEELVVETHDATGTEKETERETPGSTRDLQLPFEQEVRLCEIVKSNITVPIPELEASDANPAFAVIAVTDNTILPVGESDNNNLLEMPVPKTALVPQDRATLSDQTSCVEDSMVLTNVSAGIGKDTLSKTADSTRDLQLSIEEKETSSESDKSSQMVQVPEVEEEDTLNSHESDKSELVARIPEDTTLGSVQTIDIAAEADQDESPSIETENNNLEGVINTEPALVAQTETTTLNEQTSSIDDSVLATQVAAGHEKETVTETPQSMGNIPLLFAEEEPSQSYDNGKFNAAVPVLEVEAAEAVSAIDTCAMTHEKSSPDIEIKKDDTLELTDDLLVLTNTQPALIQQAEATPHEHIQSVEESVVQTHDATGTEKETMRETPGSTRDLQLPFKQEERWCEIDKSNITVPITEVEALEATSAFEMISVTEKYIIPVEELENNDLLEISNTKIAPVHQDKATFLDQISCAEGSMVVTGVSAGIEKDNSSKIPNSTKDLQLSVEKKEASSLYESDKSSQIVQIPEVEENDTTLGAVSTIDIAAETDRDDSPATENIAAETDRDDSPATENENNKLVGVINIVPILVTQTQAALDDETPSIEDSVVETQVASGIEEEIVHETLQSMGNLQLSFEEEETSHSHDIGKSNLEVPIPEVEATEAVSAFDTDAITHEEGFPVIEIKNDDALELTDNLLVLTNTEIGLIQQAESTPDEQIPSIEEALVETHDTTGTAKETVSEIPGSTRDLQLSFKQEESLYEIDRSNITVPLPEVEASEASPALKISNPETALVQQDKATVLDEISCVEDSIVMTNVSDGTGKDTSSKPPDSTRDLQLSVEEKEEASSLNESDKSGQMVQNPEADKSELIDQISEDTTLRVVSTIDMAAGSDQNDSPVMENDNDVLVGVTNTVPAFITQTETTLNEQTSSIDDSVTKTQVAAEIEEETARETQSMGNLQLLLEEEKISHSYDIGKSNLEVPIPEVEATEAVSAFDTIAMTHEECSPVIKIRNDNTLELTDDLLVLTELALIQHTEATPHEQMPPKEESLVATHDATGTEKETVSETPGSTRDLQPPFKQEERLCEIDESNITVPIPEVEALEPASTFEMISVTDKTIIHVGESENNDLLEMSNTETALLEKISCVEDSMVMTHVSAGIEKDISSESPYSTRDLELSVKEKEISSLHESDKSSQTVQIPEDTTIEAETTFAMSAEVDQNSSPDMRTENNKAVEVTKTVPALVAQADANLNEQISSIDDSIVVTKVASQVEEETASETLHSKEDLQLLFEKKEASSSYEIDKSNLAVLIPEAVSAFEMDTKAQKERSSVKETMNDDPLDLIDDYLAMTNIKPTLVQQAEPTLHKQMSPVEESVFETHEAAETEKETVTVNPDSTGDLQLSFEQEKGMCEIDKSNIAVPIAEIEPSEADPFEIVAVSDKINIPTIESKNNDLLEMTNMETALAQQDGATLFKQTLCVEDSMVVTYISAEIGKDSSNEIPESTRDLQLPVDEEEKSSLHESDKSSQMVQIKEDEEKDASSSSKLIVPIPENTKFGAVSTSETGAEADEDSSPAMETQNNKLVGVTNTVPALVAQAKITLNEQTSDVDDSIVVTKFASGIEEETARETPQSMGDSHLLFEEKEASNSFNTDKSNLLVLISEAEATEGLSTFDTDATTCKESSPVIEIRNDDPLQLIDDYLVLNKTEPALVQQAEATLQEQMSYIEEPVVETHIAAATEKETMTENWESTGSLQPSLREEEGMCEINISNIVVSVPEVAPSKAAPFEMVAVTEKIIIPVIESKNNDLPEMTNTETGLIQKDGATLSEQMSCVEDSMVVTHISAEIGKETSSEIPESTRDLQIAIKDIEASSWHESVKSSLQTQIPDVEEEDTLSSHDINKSELMVEIPKDTTSEAVSTFDIGAGANQGSSPAMETENNKLGGITSTLPALVAQAEITLNEQPSSMDDSTVAAHIATAIEKEIASETPQSMGDLRLLFEEKEASTSSDIDKSNLAVSIPEIGATEAFSALGKGAMSPEKSSPDIKTRNDDPLKFTDDSLVLTNSKPALSQKAEATLHEQTSSVEEPVVETHIAATTEEETVTENPDSTGDLQLSLENEERLGEIDKSNEKSSPVIEPRNDDSVGLPDDLLVLINTKDAPVQKAEATIHEQMLLIEDSVVDKHTAAATEKEIENETPESAEDLQLLEKDGLCEIDKSNVTVVVPEVEATEAAPESNVLAVPEINVVPVTKLENNDILRMTNTETAPIQLDGASLLEQMLHTEDPMVVTHVSAGI